MRNTIVDGGCQTFELVDHVLNVRASPTPKWKRLRKHEAGVWPKIDYRRYRNYKNNACCSMSKCLLQSV